MTSTDVVTALSLLEAPAGADPGAIFEVLRGGPYPWLLESAQGGEGRGRFSFVGSHPYLVVRARRRRVELEWLREVRPDLDPAIQTLEGDPIAAIRSLMPPAPGSATLQTSSPFVGGAIGFLGYELAPQVEAVSLEAPSDLDLPDLALLFVDQLVIVDHVAGRMQFAALGFGSSLPIARESAEASAEALRSRCVGGLDRSPKGSPLRPTRAASARSVQGFFDEVAYARVVEQVLDEIQQGRVYQANLTHRLEMACGEDPWQVYRRLRVESPAPFAAFLELPEVAVLSSSPECFLSVDESGGVITRPIKGTRPRGRTSAEDDALRRELVESEKERAENLMIVDLMRNDLGRVCETGSICVPELWCVEEYATLFQLVSTVEGQLASGRDVFDLLRATFPPGSMTGAPKIAAMRLIDRIEPIGRSVYSGALGYFDIRGGAALSVVIRTLLIREGRAYLNVGGGIVADSDPRAEYRETLDKARAPLRALGAVQDPDDPAGQVIGIRSR